MQLLVVVQADIEHLLAHRAVVLLLNPNLNLQSELRTPSRLVLVVLLVVMVLTLFFQPLHLRVVENKEQAVVLGVVRPIQ